MRRWELSTPSLGITLQARWFYQFTGESPFNSLSRDHREDDVLYHLDGNESFQLPLSGSLKLAAKWSLLATLGAFNSLSRDHRARFRDFPALRGFLPRHLFAQLIPKTTIWIYRFAPL